MTNPADQIAEILGLETSPDGEPYHLLTRDEDGNILEGVDYSDEVRHLERMLLEARKQGMEQAKSQVLRRTEIPRDAKNPTRDIVVVVGEECARIIDEDIKELQGQIEAADHD